MLWSMGKDSNVIIWLIKKAFFGHAPFPVLHIDTEKKFPEMYAFRERYAKEWKLNLIVDTCPPVEAVDQTLPPAARSAARKTLGLAERDRALWLQRHHRRHPARRGSGAREGARVQPARRKRAVGLPRPAAGILGLFQHRPAARHAPAGPSAAALDRDGRLALHRAREDPGGRSLFRQERQALPLARRPGHHRLRSKASPTRSRRSSSSWNRRPRRSAPAAPWTARPRTLSNGCAPRATCERGRNEHRTRFDAHRDRRPCRPWQVDPGRTAVPRHRLAARRQAGSDQGDVRAARHAVRMGVPDGFLPVGARPGHHHRHRRRSGSRRRSATTPSSTRPATASSSRT